MRRGPDIPAHTPQQPARGEASIATELIGDLAGAAALAPEWEALAVAASKPVVSAAWVLAWWRHVAPAGTTARVVAVRDGARLIGVVPFHLAGRRLGAAAEYRLMAANFGVCMEPLALPGRERDVAAAASAALAASRPRADLIGFGPMPIASPWVAAFREAGSGRVHPQAWHLRTEGAPIVHLREPSYEQWFQTLSAKLRRDLRTSERRFAEAGGTVRWADASTLRADAETFAALHIRRWAGRGWSRLADLGDGLPDWLVELGAPLIESGRFGLCVLELDGEPICVDLSLSAGSEVAGINAGWDERHAKLGPPKLAMVQVIADAYAKGAERFSLGNGPLPNQVRIANGDDPAAWTALIEPTPRLPLAYLSMAPELGRARARKWRAYWRAKAATKRGL